MKRLIGIAILMLCSIFTLGQQLNEKYGGVWIMRMNVKEITVDTNKCASQRVAWRITQDTICFYFEGWQKVMCFRNWEKPTSGKPKKLLKVWLQAEKFIDQDLHPYNSNKWGFIVKNDSDEKFIVIMKVEKTGFIIKINKIHPKPCLPSYVMTFPVESTCPPIILENPEDD